MTRLELMFLMLHVTILLVVPQQPTMQQYLERNINFNAIFQ